jgi:hypothetical protein
MKPRARRKHKGRSEGGSFSAIPHAVQDSPNWHRCGGTAIKLLLALTRQYNGYNNGDLCASASVLERFGLKRSGANPLALCELRHYGLIVLTRQGGLHAPNLYALSWHAIDDCGGKLDCRATHVAPGDWRTPREVFKRPPKKQNASTESVAHRYGIRRTKPQEAA